MHHFMNIHACRCSIVKQYQENKKLKTPEIGNISFFFLLHEIMHGLRLDYMYSCINLCMIKYLINAWNYRKYCISHSLLFGCPMFLPDVVREVMHEFMHDFIALQYGFNA